LSLTVTVNEQLAVSPAPSVTVQLTVVVPFGKAVPLAGLHTTALADSEQLSLAVGANVTTAEQRFGSVFFVIGDGQVICGACVSLTITVKLQVGPDCAVQVTVVRPTGKAEPEAGEQVTVPQLPIVVG
jgi:hypothetical protein